MRQLLFAVLLICSAMSTQAQERFSLFVGSAITDVQQMFAAAGLRDNDFVIDLGSGDGRIVHEAARLNKTVRGRGVEIDAKLVTESIEIAKKDGLADRVSFVHQNAFDADLKEATVITMWLFPELMRLLRPKILAEARPGTRVVTRTWDLGNWKPDITDPSWPYIYVWIVPAQLGGYWNWQVNIDGVDHNYSAVVEQRFQEVEGVVRSGDRRGILEDMRLRGTDVSFKLTMTIGNRSPVIHQFNGVANGDTITGSVSIQYKQDEKPRVLPWRATRARESTFFAPTGLPK